MYLSFHYLENIVFKSISGWALKIKPFSFHFHPFPNTHQMIVHTARSKPVDKLSSIAVQQLDMKLVILITLFSVARCDVNIITRLIEDTPCDAWISPEARRIFGLTGELSVVLQGSLGLCVPCHLFDIPTVHKVTIFCQTTSMEDASESSWLHQTWILYQVSNRQWPKAKTLLWSSCQSVALVVSTFSMASRSLLSTWS